MDIETCSQGGYNVGWIAADEWLKFSGVYSDGATYDVNLDVASYSAGGAFHIEVNGQDVTGSISFDATGGWQTWTPVSAGQLALGHGNNTIKLVMETAGWNVDFIEFDKASDNMVSNASFEQNFESGVGCGWTSWQSSWSNSITFGRASVNKHDGSYSQYWTRGDSARFNGGVYQKIRVTNGEDYYISAWMKRQGNASDQWLEFGYDLSGGTDPEAGSVTYTKLEGLGYNEWVHYTESVTATGAWITLFSKGGHYEEDGSSNYFYLDHVIMQDDPFTQTDTFTSIGSEDGYIRESSENSNVGGSNNSTNTNNYVGDNYTRIQYKIVLSFDTSSLPDDAVITGATVKEKRGTYYGDPSVLGDILVDIKSPSFGTTSIENSDFEASADASEVATMSYPASDGDWSEGDLNATGRGHINKSGRTQLRIYFEIDDDNDSTTDYLGFRSGDYSTEADRPQLEVEYYVP